VTRPDPKPPPRIRDSQAGLAKLRREGRCRVCGQARGLTRHHLLNRSQGGDDVDDDIVPVCDGPGVTCHRKLTTRDPATLATLRNRLSDAEVAYCVGKIGRVRFDRLYPARSEW